MSDNNRNSVNKKTEGFLIESSFDAAKKRAASSSSNNNSPLCRDDNDDDNDNAACSSLLLPPPPSSKKQRSLMVACNGEDDDDDDDDRSSNNNNNNNSNIPCCSNNDEYQGYTFSSSLSSSLEVDRITSSSNAVMMTPEIFFERYIASRRPCVLDMDSLFMTAVTASVAASASAGEPSNSNSNSNNRNNKLLTLQDLKSFDGADTLMCQVERRPNSNTEFGQNRTPEYMQELSLMEILERLQNVNTKHLYYLSTQESAVVAKNNNNNNNNNNQHDDADNNNNNEVSATLPEFSPLTQKLVQAGLIPDHLPLAGNLILQSCHLWMGGSGSANAGSGSSSGLHHDFHDNFYMLQAGRKRFTLYPPNAPIPVFGQRQCIHPNGLISYQSNPTRSDGVPLSLLLSSSCHDDNATGGIKHSDSESEEQENDDDDEEEVVIGKGFDYQSDSDDDDNDAAVANFDDEEAAVDDYDALVGDYEQSNVNDDNDDESNEDECKKKKAVVTTTSKTGNNNIKNHAKNKASNNDSSRPDSFSPVNLSMDAKELHAAFPIMKTLVPVIVELHAGECLYLPASWFHCVESFAANDDNNNDSGVHMAVNYWYHPPDRLDHFADPYHYDFWKRKTQKKA